MQKSKGKNEHIIDGLIMCGIATALLLILFGAFGKGGKPVANALLGIFGYAIYAISFALLTMGILRFFKFEFNAKITTVIGGILMFVTFVLVWQVVTARSFVTSYGAYLKGCYGSASTAGGALFGIIAYPFAKINYIFAIVLFALLCVGSIALTFFGQLNKTTLFKVNKIGEKEEKQARRLDAQGKEITSLDITSDLVITRLDGGSQKEKIAHVKNQQGHDKLRSLEELDVLREREDDVRIIDDSEESVRIFDRDVDEFNPQGLRRPNFGLEGDIESPKEKKESAKVQPTELDEAIHLLYEAPEKEVKPVIDIDDNLTKEDAAKILYSDEAIAPKETKPKKVEFSKEELSGYTNNSRMQSIIDNMRERSGIKPMQKADNSDNLASPQARDILDGIDNAGDNSDNVNINNDGSIDVEIDEIIEPSHQDKTQPIDDIRSKYDELNASEPIDLTAKNPEPTQGFDELIAKQNREKKEAEEQERMRAHLFKEQLERKRKERSDKGGSHVVSQEENAKFGAGVKFDLQNSFDFTKPEEPKVDKQAEIAAKTKPVLRPYKAPPIELLNEYVATPPENEDFSEKINILEQTLDSFGITATVVNVITGPTFTRLELQMPAGVSVSKVNSYANDIAMCLEATSVRLEIPIPGKNLFGVEIPNKTRGIVGLKALFDSPAFNNNKHNLSFAMGQDCDGKKYVMDLVKAPHLLIAGATGAGKSVCINTLICSLLYKYSPADVKFALVDPKQVELSMYNGLPHMLVEEAIYDKEKVINLLDWTVDEMEARYSLLKSRKKQGIADFNEMAIKLGEEKLPYIVIIVDEVADIVMNYKKEFEERITKIAQKARAAGIILVLATQRPSVDVITGTIKANLPTRIAFAVASNVDSKTIIDVGGAEKLLRNGDMLYSESTNPTPVRVQGAFVKGSEVGAIVDYIKANNDCYFDPDIAEAVNRTKQAEANPNNKVINGGDRDIDPAFVKALHFVVEVGECSVSKIQRRYSYGFQRAAKIVDKMEELGYISKAMDNKKREVYLDMETFMSVYGDFEIE